MKILKSYGMLFLYMSERVSKIASVSRRIQEIKQPRGGFVKLSEFEAIAFDDGKTLNPTENIHASIVGIVVDYLTRFMLGERKEDAFRVSLFGANIAEAFGLNNASKIAKGFCSKIEGLDKESIINACKLSTFDVWRRNPIEAMNARTYKETNPDDVTIYNITILVSRSIAFFEKYGPIKVSGFTFEPPDTEVEKALGEDAPVVWGGYTKTIDSGDGDFLTEDTMWDFKVSASKPTSKHTLQLLSYWVMGKHSGQSIYNTITKIGFFNPRMNIVYLLDMRKVPTETIRIIENEVICYGTKPIKVKRDKSWVYYMTEKEYETQRMLAGILKEGFVGDSSGKWIIPCDSYEYAGNLCRLAVEECDVAEARHSLDFSTGEGVCWFYIPSDRIRKTKQFISYFLENDLLPKTKDGKYENIEFRSDWYTMLGLYDDAGFTGGIFLCDYIDLDSGEWTDKSYEWEMEEEKKTRILDMSQKYTGSSVYNTESHLRNEDSINTDYIKDEIKKQGKTIKEIANYLDVKDATVRAWINGKTKPLVGNAMALCLCLGLNVSSVIVKKE